MNVAKRLITVLLVSIVPLAAAAWPAGWSGPAASPDDDPLPGGAIEGTIDGRKVTCPLLRTEMTAHIRADTATVMLVQTFENPHKEPMHARYVFPLPPNAAVYDMQFVVGERVIRAEIQEKQQAKETFEEAKRQGKQAALLEQHRPNVFTQQVANLMPGKPIRVELHYAHAVPKRDGSYRFHFPMVVGPRYIPQSRGGDGEPEPVELGSWSLPASPPVTSPESIDPERVGILVHIDAGVPVQWIDSSSHVIDVHQHGPGKRTVRLAAGRTIDNQDFVLRYALESGKAAVGSATWARGGKGVVGLLIEPPARAAEPAVTPREMVFVLDCSGSMHGVPLDTSKRFMRKALGNLRPTDHFRVIQFSNAAAEFSSRPLEASKGNIARGLTYINSLYGGGGTEMITGIRAAFDPAPPEGALRIVVFLTDGYVGNDADIVRLIHARRGDARLFSFGIGNAVNRYLLSEMARAGRGVARFVRPDEDAAEAADRLAKRLEAPFLTDVRIDWGDAPVTDPTPARLPDLFLGESLRVLARYDRPGTFEVSVEGKTAGGTARLPLSVTLPAEDEGGQALDILWARGQVEDRMIDFLDPAAGEDKRREIKKEVIALGLAHRLVTQWTSFVAVDREVVNPRGEGAERDVAVPRVKGVSKAAYPLSSFFGSSAPEPAEWAAIALLLLMAAWWLRR